MNSRYWLCLAASFLTMEAWGASPGNLVSGTSRVSSSAGGASSQPVLSPDGRFVAFVSQANNLATNDTHAPYFDVFLRDRLGDAMVLVSVSTNGAGGGDDHSVGPSVSADGRYVAFQSAAGNLASNDTNGLSDIFLRDTVAGHTLLVSRQLNGWTALGRASTAPLISTNGRWLVYESAAGSLVPNDTNDASDIFIFDRQTGSNALVSVNEANNGSGAGSSQAPHLTPDGRFVAFVNFLSNANPAVGHVFVRDLWVGTNLWASSNAAVQLGSHLGVAYPVLSADGSAVFFHAYNSVTTNLYRCGLADGTTALISEFSSSLTPPSPNADGRFVAFESNGVVRVADTQAGTNGLASVTQAGEPAPSAEGPLRPVLSAGGNKVCFLSGAALLTGDPTNGLMQLYQRDLVAHVTLLLSKDLSGAAAGDLSAGIPAMSTDGGVVAFESPAATVVADDFNAAPDVFARDVAMETTTLISRRDAALPSTTSVAMAIGFTNGVSADGRYVAFGSFDSSLFPGDTNVLQDAFLRDLVTGTVEPINIGPGGTLTNANNVRELVLSAGGRHAAWVRSFVPSPANPSTILWRDLDAGSTRVVSAFLSSDFSAINAAPTISANGQWVAFQTTRRVSELEPAITDANIFRSDIVLQDVIAGTNSVISLSRSGLSTANGDSVSPQFSPDGRWLAFVSASTDLTTNAVMGQHLFIRDLASRTILAVSALISNANGYAGGARFSSDSRHLAFNALSNLVGVFDLQTRTGDVLPLSNVRNPSLSADGRYVAVENILVRNVTLLDRLTGVATVVGDPGLQSSYPLLAGNGRYLLFLSRSFPGDPVELRQSLFVYNLARRITLPLPVSVDAGQGNGPTYLPQLAADDRTLVFTSFASNLVPGDFNDRRDVFVLRLAGPDSDGDGMDDDFEAAYFGHLSRDGNGDFDGDGSSDRDESLAGTDPTNQGSVLRALTVTSVTGNSTTVLWEAVPGRHYVVQFKDEVAADWATLPGQVTATAATASKVDVHVPRPTTRFYRIELVP